MCFEHKPHGVSVWIMGSSYSKKKKKEEEEDCSRSHIQVLHASQVRTKKTTISIKFIKYLIQKIKKTFFQECVSGTAMSIFNQ
jgi:hypothetical protein